MDTQELQKLLGKKVEISVEIDSDDDEITLRKGSAQKSDCTNIDENVQIENEEEEDEDEGKALI